MMELLPREEKKNSLHKEHHICIMCSACVLPGSQAPQGSHDHASSLQENCKEYLVRRSI